MQIMLRYFDIFCSEWFLIKGGLCYIMVLYRHLKIVKFSWATIVQLNQYFLIKKVSSIPTLCDNFSLDLRLPVRSTDIPTLTLWGKWLMLQLNKHKENKTCWLKRICQYSIINRNLVGGKSCSRIVNTFCFLGCLFSNYEGICFSRK